MAPMPHASQPSPVDRAFTVEPLTHDAVDDYARLHAELTLIAYAHQTSPAFARARRAEVAGAITALHDELDAAAAAARQGRPAFRRHLVARNPRGGLVGVASGGEGIGSWEPDELGTRWTPPTTTRTVEHLYTVPGVHGSGVGQTLLDALIGDDPAYLWCIDGNDRALAFYRRNGFEADGLTHVCSEPWDGLSMSRLVRGVR